MTDAPTVRPYGTERHRRAALSYGEIERAATALLSQGQRPTVEGIQNALGGGSPKTLLEALRRFWRELATRIEGNAPSLTRLPAEVADLAEGLWSSALVRAAEVTSRTAQSAQERLEPLRRENELRAHSISLREKELDALLRARERTVSALETHLATSMSFVAKAQAEIRSLERRLSAAEADAEEARRRLTHLMARVVARHRTARKPSSTAAAQKLAASPRKRPGPKRKRPAPETRRRTRALRRRFHRR